MTEAGNAPSQLIYCTNKRLLNSIDTLNADHVMEFDAQV